MLIRSIIRTYLARRLRVPEIQFALERLKANGFNPGLIFDVGAYKGSFAKDTINLWPSAKVACFEAQAAQIQTLYKLSNIYSQIQVFPGLVGAESRDRVAFYENETASSVLTEHISTNFEMKTYPMSTLDEVAISHYDGRGPDLLKLDVQGYELEVLKGAEKVLLQTSAILAEVNFIDIHQNVPLLDEFIYWLSQRDWVPYDICALTRRPLDDALWQADMIFVKRSSSFRNDKRWNL